MSNLFAFLSITLSILAAGCTPQHPAAHVPPPPAARATVLFFIATDCPISNGYAPEIIRICNEYMPRGVTFQAVYPDPDSTPEQVALHRAEYAVPCPAVTDPDHRLTQQAGATVTPEVAVFVPTTTPSQTRLVYRGRIDDRHTDLGRSRPTPAVRDLRDILNAVLAGDAPMNPVTKPAIGCAIPSTRRPH